jgi:cell division transport system ATP-binding protein
MAKIKRNIIDIEDVSKEYEPDIVALSHIDIQIEKGEFIFLTGPSGSGKSTLLRLLFCAELATDGELWIDGIPLSSISNLQIPDLRRKIGVVFQDFKLLNNRSVFDNVALSLEVLGLEKKQVDARVKDLLEGIGLGGKINRFPLQLSGGEQQRVAIARAVVNRPPIILADEPTGNLDSKRAWEVMELMEELNAMGATIIFATHNENFFKNTHRRLICLKDGEMV